MSQASIRQTSTGEEKMVGTDKTRTTPPQAVVPSAAPSVTDHEAHGQAASGTVISSGQSVKEGIMLEPMTHLDGSEQGDGAFKKDLGWIGMLAAGYNMTNCWLVVAATMTVSLPYGPMTTVWGVIIISPIYLCIGLTLAELIAAYPTTGGQYHWASILAPPRIRKAVSYLTGFTSWFSWMTLAASSAGAISLCSNALIFNANPDYQPKAWQEFLFYEGTLIITLCLNLFGKKILSPFYSAAFFLSLAAFIVFTVTTLAMQKQRQDSATIWTSYTEVSGWSPGVQIIIALASPIIAFCPLDGAVHLVEEVNDASKVVPRTVLAALAIAFVTLLTFVLAMLYCVTDFDAVLATPSGFPLFEIWSQATRTTAVPIVFTVVCIILLPVGTTVTCQVASMMTWSLAKDGGLPFPEHLAKVHAKLNAPVWSLLLNFIIMFLIGCLYLFSTLAYNSIIGVASILQQLTFFVPTVLLIYHRRSDNILPPTRSFQLPSWLGWICNIVTVLFTFITTSFMLLPATANPGVNSMNYACVVLAGVFLLAFINWLVFARRRYNGPTSIKFHH